MVEAEQRTPRSLTARERSAALRCKYLLAFPEAALSLLREAVLRDQKLLSKLVL